MKKTLQERVEHLHDNALIELKRLYDLQETHKNNGRWAYVIKAEGCIITQKKHCTALEMLLR